MNKLTDKTFFAWLDGELGDAEAASVAAQVAADAELSARAAEHRALANRLRSAFGPVAEAPLPERIAATLKTSQSNVVDLADRRTENRERRAGGLPQWAAMAAALALGVFLGTQVTGSGGPVETRNGAMFASGSVDAALDSHLASAGSGGGDVRVLLTFRDRSGTICRSFTATSATGLACREGNEWRLRGLVGPAEGQSSDYRMAAGQDPILADLIDGMIAGDPFDAAQEAKARDGGWR